MIISVLLAFLMQRFLMVQQDFANVSKVFIINNPQMNAYPVINFVKHVMVLLLINVIYAKKEDPYGMENVKIVVSQ